MLRDRDAAVVEREKLWGGCPLTIRLWVWGSVVVSSPSRVRAGRKWIVSFVCIFEIRNKATCNTFFSIYERWRGPQMCRGPGKLFPLPSRRACSPAGTARGTPPLPGSPAGFTGVASRQRDGKEMVLLNIWRDQPPEKKGK